tara:strand:- start:653 stop:832 length:180 start_codon:yes stop_codon:yes gene_type:complete
MAEDHIELIATILLFLFGVTMLYQGHLIYHGKGGYLNMFRQQHEQDRVRKQVEDLVKGK